ncbi:MAG: DUF2079 domain-containing protein [Clostridia bacterium]|nr:DUF2079 domain-containing protein [Clostridia bacterium]
MKKLFCKPFEIYLTRFISAWLVAECVLIAINPSFGLLSFARDASIPVLACAFVAALVAIFALDFIFPKANIDGFSFFISTMGFAFSMAIAYKGIDTMYVYLAIVAAAAFIIYYLWQKNRLPFSGVEFSGVATASIIAVATIGFAIFVGSVTVCRYLTYYAPNFDFGIFCQMFHNMKETGLPNTTCERDFLLSHFGVHVSPIYYLILPFYAVFPSPVTLQIAQTVIISSAIIPLCLLCKKYNLSNKATVLISFIFLAYPAMSGGAMYDIHENCFLVPLLLWMFYFFEKEKWLWMYVFAALTLLVKEDAFAYIVIFALYACVGRKSAKRCAPLVLLAGVYFAFASYYLSTYGMGVMSNRFGNFIYDDSGLLGVVKTLVLNPAYLFTQIFSSSSHGNEKLFYLLQLLIPVCFIIFMTKKPSRFILVLPIFINLIATYAYQYDIGFQYGFAISAFFFYLLIMNVSEMSDNAKRIALPIAAVAACLAFCMFILPRGGPVRAYRESKATYQQMDAILDTIPDDASVAASTFLLPHVADRAEVYEVFYHKSRDDVDYVVLDMRPGYAAESAFFREEFLANGYEIDQAHDGLITVLVKK